MNLAGQGPNIGHGYVKYVIIDREGVEHKPVIFPAIVGRAARTVTGTIARAETVSRATLPGGWARMRCWRPLR